VKIGNRVGISMSRILSTAFAAAIGAHAVVGGNGMNYLAKRIMLTLGLLLVPTSLAAQESASQTPENAQRFLQLTLPNRFQLCNRSGCVDATRTSPVEISKNVCFTPFNLSYFNLSNVAMGFLWDSIANVKQQNTQVDLVSTNGPTYIIDFKSDALATRAAFAMEFLRQHCDRAKDTGF
jgi:hypothetical protein